MFRHSFSQVIVLHVYNIGEYHRGITLLTPEQGIISAIAHGAKKLKSRFRSITENFTLAKVYLYYDPVKQSYKITDMEAMETFPGIRQSLVRFYTASLWTEIILKSYAGGEHGSGLFELLTQCLRRIHNLEESKVVYLSLQFIWRFIQQNGYGPSLEGCEQCGRLISREEAMYLGSYHLYCPQCAVQKELAILPGARQYLQSSLQQSLDDALRIKLEAKSLLCLKESLYVLIQRLLETKLKSIECTGGVI